MTDLSTTHSSVYFCKASRLESTKVMLTHPIFMQANLDDVVKAMAMPAADLGDNLERFLLKNQPEDPRSTPADLAYSHVTPVSFLQPLRCS